MALAVAGGCGSPAGPLPMGPAIACPPGIARESLDGQPISVAFDVPVAAGGSRPVTVTCAPAPGAMFAVGPTPVTCTAADAVGRTGTCGFVVTVVRPRLVATRFLAFGDSLTYGSISLAPTVLLETIPDSYPFKLQKLVTARYQTQAPAVLNDGIGGERVIGPSDHSPGGGLVRLPGSLDTHRPEVVLLMEGTNDLLDLEPGAQTALSGLEQMVRLARGRSIRVLLATIPPQRAGGIRRRDRVAALIPSFNDSVRQIAAREGATLVDVYNALKDRLDLIGVDDLHPTPQGYDVIAQTWFDAIKTTLEERASLAAR